ITLRTQASSNQQYPCELLVRGMLRLPISNHPSRPRSVEIVRRRLRESRCAGPPSELAALCKQAPASQLFGRTSLFPRAEQAARVREPRSVSDSDLDSPRSPLKLSLVAMQIGTHASP